MMARCKLQDARTLRAFYSSLEREDLLSFFVAEQETGFPMRTEAPVEWRLLTTCLRALAYTPELEELLTEVDHAE